MWQGTLLAFTLATERGIFSHRQILETGIASGVGKAGSAQSRFSHVVRIVRKNEVEVAVENARRALI